MAHRFHLSIRQLDVCRDVHHHLQVSDLLALRDLVDHFSGLPHRFRNELLVPPDIPCLRFHHQRLLHWRSQLRKEELLSGSLGEVERVQRGLAVRYRRLVLRSARLADASEFQFPVRLLLACLRDVEREDLAPVLGTDTLAQLGFPCLGGGDQDDGSSFSLSGSELGCGLVVGLLFLLLLLGLDLRSYLLPKPLSQARVVFLCWHRQTEWGTGERSVNPLDTECPRVSR